MFSFGSQEGAYKTLLNASAGEVYDIERVKEGEFQNWVSAKKSDGNASTASPQATASATQAGKSTYTSPKSSYPTDEERAKTQVYIVRQSNITAAINTLSVGAKTPPKVADILATAKLFEDHVFGNSNDSVADAVPFNATTAFDDLDDMPQ